MDHVITIHPQAGLPGAPDDTASVAGAVLTHNGRDYDLSSIPEGGEGMPAGEHPFVGPIKRIGDELHYGLRRIYDKRTAQRVQEVRTVTISNRSLPDTIARLT